LRERQIELAIFRLHGPAVQEDVDMEALHDDTFMVVAGAKTRWASSRRVSLADLVHEPWTLPPLDTWSGALIQKAFRKAGLAFPQATVFTLSQQLRTNLAASGRFLTVLPDYQMRLRRSSAVTALPIALSATRRQVGIVTLRNRALSPVAWLFIDCAREVAKQFAGDK
jgi:DNA-binding transcriptional LysR family regulator